MTSKKAAIGKQTSKLKKVKKKRAKKTAEKRELCLQENRNGIFRSRITETEEDRESRLQQKRDTASSSRATETTQQRITRLDADRDRMAQSRKRIDLNFAVFNYNKDDDYRNHKDVVIGAMNNVCLHCGAFKFAKEFPGMCCLNGKVVLPFVIQPPEPLLSYISNLYFDFQIFFQNIRKYNSSLLMTSFGATNVVNNAGYLPTFKVQGQIYHRIGSLLPVPDEDAKFLQIYFTGNEDTKADERCAISTEVRREIILNLQAMFHGHNSLIRSFKTALDEMLTEDYKVVMRADRAPPGEHKRRFDAPVKDDVAVVVVGTEFERRDIIVHLQNANVQRGSLSSRHVKQFIRL